MERTIEICSDQTLEDLHHAIFVAFDRFEEHMYEFQVGGMGPQDPNAKRYALPMALEYEADMATLPTKHQSPKPGTVDAPLGSLGLKENDVFGYWFDFGDDWWHQIEVMKISSPPDKGPYPRITERIGDSPPQYLDLDADMDAYDDDVDQEWDGIKLLPYGEVRPYNSQLHLQKLLARYVGVEKERFLDIATLIDECTDEHLTDEYKMLGYNLLAQLTMIPEFPWRQGKPHSWAAGILYLIGQANFLGDPESEPYMKSSDLAKAIGISTGTMYLKAARINNDIEVGPMVPQWILPSQFNDHPVTQAVMRMMAMNHPDMTIPEDNQPRLN
ncbi:MAG: DUF6398 domain-containing protein [Phycisphaeraceae bacterium JB051]